MAQQHPRPQSSRYPQAGPGPNGRPVPPQPGPPDLPRTGAAQRPGAGRPDDRRPGHPGPQRRSASGGATSSRGTGGSAGPGATRRVGPPSSGLPTRVATTSHPSTPSGGTPTTAASASTAAVSATVEEKKPDLTVNKIIAGAGAAATTAVFGSFFGATGTVAGAALGSVVTTLGTTLYQRSLDRTKETVLARVKIPGKKDAVVIAEPVDPLATIPLQRRADEGAGPTMLQPALGDAAAEGLAEQT